MKLLPRSVFGSLGSLVSPKKGKEKGTGKDTAAPSVLPAVGKDIPSPSVPNVVENLPTPTAKNTPIHSNAETLAKDSPTANTLIPSSANDGNLKPSTVTTTTTVSTTDTKTVTSAAVTKTVTTIRHEIVTITKTDISSKSVSPTSTPTTLPAGSVAAVPKKRIDSIIVVSVVFGLLILILLGVVAYLALKCRRLAKAKAAGEMKTFAEEFEWTEDGHILKEKEAGVGMRTDEWGLERKELSRLSNRR